MSRTRLKVSIQRAVRSASLPAAAEIRRWVAAAAAPGATGEIAIRLIGDDESAELNERYRGRSGPTNVLAFPADDDDGDGDDDDGVSGRVVGGFDFIGDASGSGDEIGLDDDLVPIGDLAVCVPVVEREAADQGKPFAAHLAHIVVHGTLHLFGYDHMDDAEAAEMEARERVVLAAFGLPDPYASEAAHGEGAAPTGAAGKARPA